MINQLTAFVTNHWELVAVFVAILSVLVFTEKRGSIKDLSSSAAITMINNNNAIFLDVRPEKEFKVGHITGALNVPAIQIKNNLEKLEKYKDTPVIVVCKSGFDSKLSVKELTKAGFVKVFRLQGGITEWHNSNLPLVKK